MPRRQFFANALKRATRLTYPLLTLRGRIAETIDVFEMGCRSGQSASPEQSAPLPGYQRPFRSDGFSSSRWKPWTLMYPDLYDSTAKLRICPSRH